MTDEAFTYACEIAASDFDLSLLPAGARKVGSDEFRKAVTALIEEEFKGFAGWARILVDDARICVSWREKPEAPDPMGVAVEHLKRGDHRRGIQLLKLILPSRPDSSAVHFNLGVALSEQGQLDDAVKHLREALKIKPDFTDAKAALGAALGRKGQFDSAYEVLAEAANEAPDNPYVLRTLGATMVSLGKEPARAEGYLRKAVQFLPDDQISRFGLAQALLIQGKLAEADAGFLKTIEINSSSAIAEKARRHRSALAQESFREGVGGAPRMDAMMYCLSALEKFGGMSLADVRKIGFEVAALGTKGIDPNNPDKKLDLRSMPGQYTGLQLLSIMYVAFKKVAPEMDIGFDLSKEYRLALMLHEGRKGG